jgi:hypothetical protein
MNDRLNLELQDHALLAEIAMVTDLMITANGSTGPLCHHTIDAVLEIPGRSHATLGRCRCARDAERWAASVCG